MTSTTRIAIAVFLIVVALLYLVVLVTTTAAPVPPPKVRAGGRQPPTPLLLSYEWDTGAGGRDQLFIYTGGRAVGVDTLDGMMYEGTWQLLGGILDYDMYQLAAPARQWSGARYLTAEQAKLLRKDIANRKPRRSP